MFTAEILRIENKTDWTKLNQSGKILPRDYL
jgi:hypothetical protein